MPSLGRIATRFGALHCNSRVSSMRTTRSGVFETSARRALVSVVFPVDVPPATRILLRSATAARSVSAWRSEEHTSELQSLMRISYAVFCLKKKNKTKHTHYNNILTFKQ